MARGRMIDREFYRNEDLGLLPIGARYLYASTIVHADDRGRMKAGVRYLRGLTWPYDDDIPVEKVSEWRELLAQQPHNPKKKPLIVIYEVDGEEYLYHPNWERWQTIRKDRSKPSDCPHPSTKCQPSDNQMVAPAPRNRIEGKLTEPNQIKKKNIFVKPSFEEVTAYGQTIDFKIDGREFVDYYEARGWRYKTGQPMVDWKAAVRTWKKNNFEKGANESGKPNLFERLSGSFTPRDSKPPVG